MEVQISPIWWKGVKQMNLSHRATFTGRIPDDEMLARLCACDLCVQPDPLNALNDKSDHEQGHGVHGPGKNPWWHLI